MGLIILEGLDRVGKTSVAQWYEQQGYEIIHMCAPPKGQTADVFLEEMMQIVSLAAHKNVILDRSYYGEAFIWPKIYDRTPLIDEDGIELLRELEDTVGTTRILLHDPNNDAHWKRCVENKEPITKIQFVKAKSLYSSMADKYGFVRKTLLDFPNAMQPLPTVAQQPTVKDETVINDVKATNTPAPTTTQDQKTKEQLKLERANAINDILSKRIIKGKGVIYDELERSVRRFLNDELGRIFGNAGNNQNNAQFNNEEIELLKFFCKRLKDKEG